MELMAAQSGVTFTHVPGKGGGESMSALLGGHVMVVVESPAWAPLVESGEVRLLMMLGGQRSKKWPDAPVLKELGYTYEFDSPFGLAGPKGMDPAIVKKLHDAFKKAYDDPAMPALYEKFDFARRYMNTEDYQAYVPKMAADEKAALEKLGLAKKE
jgi:tripartite-type tricarboxylate transporter receptor subunit TctC